jgi:hypothetical protein
MTRAEPPPAPGLARLLGASALAGCATGALRPALHAAIEPAQVLAGVVVYPDGNPFALYQASLWTIWHQLLAPLLAAGIPERTLSMVLSGAMGALAFAAIALFARGQGAALWLAFAVPFLLVQANTTQWGLNYPIFLVGHPHTYGMAGLSWLLLVVALLGAERWGAAAFLLGLAPALHASLGAWLGLVVAAAALAGVRELRPHARALLVGGAAGVAASVASLVLHLAGPRAQPPAVDPSVASTYLDTFVRLWDVHRAPLALRDWRVLVVACELALVWLSLRAAPRPGPGAALALRTLAGVSLLGLAVVAAQDLGLLDALPDAIVVAMPTRLLNLPMLAFVPLLAGVLWRFRADPAARVALLALCAGALAGPGRPALARVGLPLLGLLAVALVARGGDLAGALRHPRATAPRAPRPTAGVARGLDAAIALACAAAVAWVGATSVQSLRPRLRMLIDSTNDRALAEAARGNGLLAVGSGIPFPQLRTRRPVLIDPTALDMLPYAPAGGPALAHILDGVYGVDFFAPPESALQSAGVPEEPVRALFERRSAADWSALGAEFGFTQVLVRVPWRLRLPLLARSRDVALYRVPPPEGGRTEEPASARREGERGQRDGPSGSQ